jgi:hypothetical protein
VKYKFALIIIFSFFFLTHTPLGEAHVYGGSESVVTESNYGVTIDFPLWGSAVAYFETFSFIHSVQVQTDTNTPYVGTTKIFFEPDLDPNDYFVLDFELNMLSRMWYNDIARWMWGGAFPKDRSYYFSGNNVVQCMPYFEPSLGYRVLRCYN